MGRSKERRDGFLIASGTIDNSDQKQQQQQQQQTSAAQSAGRSGPVRRSVNGYVCTNLTEDTKRFQRLFSPLRSPVAGRMKLAFFPSL